MVVLFFFSLVDGLVRGAVHADKDEAANDRTNEQHEEDGDCDNSSGMA